MGLPEGDDKDKGAEAVEQVIVPVKYPDAPAIAAETKNAALLESGKFPKRVVIDGVRSLLEGELADETDRPLLTAAIEFIENPTDNFEEIKLHTKTISQIGSMSYDMQGEDIPPAIEALEPYFYGLQVVNRMNFVEGEFARGVDDSEEVEDAITLALADAEILATKFAKETTLLEAATALHDGLAPSSKQRLLDIKEANAAKRSIRKRDRALEEAN